MATTRPAPAARAAITIQWRTGRPAILWRTLAVSLFIRVPRPAAMMNTIGAGRLMSGEPYPKIVTPIRSRSGTIGRMRRAVLAALLAACGAELGTGGGGSDQPLDAPAFDGPSSDAAVDARACAGG